MVEVLTGRKGHLLEFLIPRVGDLDSLLLANDAFGAVSLLRGVLHNLLEIFWVDRVKDVEEVLTARISLVGVFVLKVDDEGGVLLDILPQVLDGKFLVVGHVDIVDRLLLQEFLFVIEDLLKKIFINLGFRRTIVLHYRGVRINNNITHSDGPNS